MYAGIRAVVYPCVRIGGAHPVGAPRAGFVQCMQSIAVPAANKQRTGGGHSFGLQECLPVCVSVAWLGLAWLGRASAERNRVRPVRQVNRTWHARGARHRRCLRMGADLIRPLVHVLDELDLRYLVPAARHEHSMLTHPPAALRRSSSPFRKGGGAAGSKRQPDSRRAVPYPSRKSRCNTRKRRPPTASTRDCPSGSCTAQRQWAAVGLQGRSHRGCRSQLCYLGARSGSG